MFATLTEDIVHIPDILAKAFPQNVEDINTILVYLIKITFFGRSIH